MVLSRSKFSLTYQVCIQWEQQRPFFAKGQKADMYKTLGGHRAGEASILYEHGADVEAPMPKLQKSDYLMLPRIHELALSQ
ncbi:Nucleoporin autopeptidase [Trifolium repens]|nr:Nucleoporin autopeptidase [Trifolium repens]